MARVSVIIPTRNRAKMLRRAIESAKHAGEDVQVIVVDDASTDETGSMCRDLTDITYVRMEQNVGVAQARNSGILKSTGEFLAFLDDDDLRIPGSIDKQTHILSKNDNLSLVYGKIQIVDSENRLLPGELRPYHCKTGDIFWELLKENFITASFVLVRKRHFESVGLFDPALRAAEDWDAWIRLAETYTVDAIQEPVAIYRDFTRGSGQLSSNRPIMCKASAQTLFKALRSRRALAAEPGTLRKVRSELMNTLWDILVREGSFSISSDQFEQNCDNVMPI